MTRFGKKSAVMFDMDGTLVDTELLNEPVIRSVCDTLGVTCPDFDWTRFHGVSWTDIARQITDKVEARPDAADLARRLHTKYEELCTADPPPQIPGARDAVVGAHAFVATGIVSSSFRNAIYATIRQMELDGYVNLVTGAEDYANSKPAPDGYLHAASMLGVDPAECLVFEDSIAGIRSARAAGMQVIAVTFRSNVSAGELQLADDAITNFDELEEGFFARIGRK